MGKRSRERTKLLKGGRKAEREKKLASQSVSELDVDCEFSDFSSNFSLSRNWQIELACWLGAYMHACFQRLYSHLRTYSRSVPWSPLGQKIKIDLSTWLGFNFSKFCLRLPYAELPCSKYEAFIFCKIDLNKAFSIWFFFQERNQSSDLYFHDMMY